MWLSSDEVSTSSSSVRPERALWRSRPLVLVATPDADLAQQLTDEIHRLGFVACVARSAAGCLRVATAVGPDLVLLDARVPRHLEGMLRSHPATATTRVMRVGGPTGSAVAREEAWVAWIHDTRTAPRCVALQSSH
jgi:CheY-like chemotaxis protein